MIDASAAGFASVASQLVAFYREPARFRPYYIHGEEPLPEGHVVLKFALGRFDSARGPTPMDREQLVAAARAFVRQVCLRERATHYQVLCLEEGAARDTIRENYRLLMALIHPDRQDADANEWPTNCAQRVNEAYATLSEGPSRKAYDEMMRKSHVSAPFEYVAPAPVDGSPRRAGGGYLRRFAVVAMMLVAVFAVQAWWMGDTPQHYSLLERAVALRDAQGWRVEMPRFMDVRPAMSFDPIELFKPSHKPLRLASTSIRPQDLPKDAAPAAPAAAPPAPMQPANVGPSPVPVPAPEAAHAQARPDPRPARIEPAPTLPAMPVIRLAQASAQPGPAAAQVSPGASGPTVDDIELVVAQLVSAYEEGSADGLMALFDTDQLGMWKGFRVRNTYADFFRATRTRRLRLDKLTWQTAGATARAQGGATLIADYADGGNRIERKVDMEIDLALRDGRLRISRLLLFPDVK